MSTDSKGFISDIFNDAESTSEVGDVRQSLLYNLVKAYPSVNSSNEGHIHSEENIRWLTKQFIKKPFIVQYDNNDMEEFWYEGSALNAGVTRGGIVNIDGYLINTAEDMTKLSYDNTEDTNLGTGSGAGYIWHQPLQHAIEQFVDGFSSDVKTHIDETKLLEVTREFSEEKEKVTEFNWTTIRSGIIKEFVNKSDSPYRDIGSVTITYTEPVYNYITKNIDTASIETYVDTSTKDESTGKITGSCKVTYPVYYGFVEGKFIPKTGRVTSIDDEGNESKKESSIPSLFTKDVFGFTYFYQSDLTVSTNSYPSTFNTNINFLNDDITPDLGQANNEIIKGITNIYDMSESYRSYCRGKNAEDPGVIGSITTVDDKNSVTIEYAVADSNGNLDNCYAYFLYNILDEESKDPDSENFLNFYIKTSKKPTPQNVQNFFKDEYFNIVNYDNIFTMYEGYKGSSYNITQEDLEKTLNSICDNYYCLPLDKIGDTTYSDNFFKLFCLKSYDDNNYVPVGFITSSGALMAKNVQYTQRDSENNPETKILVESYVSFIRRMCKILCGLESNTTYKGHDISDSNVDSKGWNILLKDFQTGAITIDETKFISQRIAIENFFNESITTINFDVVYNKLIAPYMNFYLQLAWSALYDNTLSDKGFKPHNAFSVINEQLQNPDNKDSIIIVESDTEHITLELNKIYTHNDTEFTVPKKIPYYINTYTDYERFNKFLCGTTKNYLRDSTKDDNYISYRERLKNVGISDCEDYITYLQKCSQPSWDYNFNEDSDLITIPYKVTSLKHDTNSYGFDTFNHLVDSYRRYTNKLLKGNSENEDDPLNLDYENATWDNGSTAIIRLKPGYIQNVAISLHTLVPMRQNDLSHYFPNKYAYTKDIKIGEKTISTNTQTDDGKMVDIISGSTEFNWYVPVHSKNSGGNIGFTNKILYHDSWVTTNFTQPNEYPLWMVQRHTIEYDGSQSFGLSGFAFLGNSQGWSVYIPTIFRLYKDSQKYLNGRLKGTNKHGGIYVDYKLPRDITDKDFWFSNTWLSTVRTITTWDIENNGVGIPSNTDGMKEYLNRRNHTLFHVDKIYSVDDSGNYITLDEYINSFTNDLHNTVNNEINEKIDTVNNEINELTNNINSQPELSYVEYISSTDGTAPTIEAITKNGLFDNTEALYDYINNSSWINSYPSYSSRSTGNVCYINNNTYYHISNYNAEQLNIKVSVPNNRNWLNTSKGTISNNNVIRSTIKFSMKNYNSVKINLDTVLNSYNNGAKGVFVDWASNYPMEISTTGDESGGTLHNIYTVQITDYYNDTLSCLIELTITPNSDMTTATGYCNISILSNPKILTLMDMNYLWKELYSLDRISWQQVSELTKIGLADKLWSLGDTKTFDVTYEGTTYSIPAMIIGFDSEPNGSYENSNTNTHTITWLTNIYNSGINTKDCKLFNKKFRPQLESSNRTAGKYGYNAYGTLNKDTKRDYYYLDVVAWLNKNYYDIPDVENTSNYPKSIISYTDKGFLSVTTQTYKTNNLVYTYTDTDGTYKYSTAERNYNSGKNPLTFWLPSLSELGIAFIDNDVIENFLYKKGSQLRTTGVKAGRSYTNELSNQSDTITYPYFKLDKNKQNVKSLTLLCSSFYTINLDLNELDEVPDDEDEKNEYVQDVDNYDQVNRIMYTVGASYSKEYNDGRWFSVIPQSDIDTVLGHSVQTDFCFITI